MYAVKLLFDNKRLSHGWQCDMIFIKRVVVRYHERARNERVSDITPTRVFSSAVPPGSGAFQMPTCPSSSASASAASAASASASTLRGGRANLRNASVTFSLFLHEASLG